MFSKKSFLILSLAITITLSVTARALEYSSYIFTTKDVIFFSYENATQVQVYNSMGQLVWPEGPDVILSKGQHAWAEFENINQVYKVCGSNKFAVLTGDPTSVGISGYYAMDANGLGTSTEFYTYVPYINTGFVGTQLFIVFAYQDNTQVTVQQDVGNGVYQNVNTFILKKGEHWANPEFSNKYLHIIADKPVSALTCYDQGYFVPSANGKWSGTEFYTYVSDIGFDYPWPEDLTVIAYDNDTFVTIKDTNDPNIVIWSGTLNNGQAFVVKCPEDANLATYYTIESNKTVTVSVQPWVSVQSDYEQGVFIPDREGTGIGSRFGGNFIGSTLNGGIYCVAYLYILAHTNNTHVKLYNSQTGSLQASYTLNKGQAIDVNPGNGLWRIVSDRYISAYSGCGHATAEFAPLVFAGPFEFNKTATFEGDCVVPDVNITYTISYDANGTAAENVVITDYLPQEVTYDYILDWNTLAVDANYDPETHTYTWNIGTLAPDDAGSVDLIVQVNQLAEPLGTIRNYCEIESDRYFNFAAVDTNICCWDVNVIYVDVNAADFGTGMSWENAYTDLQSALERAGNCYYAGQIWVAEGTYKPAATFELVDGVAIYGGFPAGGGTWQQRNPVIHETILDGNLGDETWVSYVVTSSNITDAILDGFTIKCGSMAGLYCCNESTPTIKNCKITNNSRDSWGNGGIYCTGNSSLNTANCEISSNNCGGGINCSDCNTLTVTDCNITGNSAYTGGGINCSNSSNLTVTYCIISDNNAQYGGGIYNYINSTSAITNCIFSDNKAYDDGGGLLNQSLNPVIRNCVFTHNTASSNGGGVCCQGGTPTITNCTFRVNQAEYGGGIYNDYSYPNVTNSIFWDNTATTDGNEIYNYFWGPSAPNFSYCDIEGGLNGQGCGGDDSDGHDNINADPCFYNPNDPNEYHLGAGSPCIDVGTNNPPEGTLPETDIDGEDRVIDGDGNGSVIVDIGADEYYKSGADFDNNDFVNFFDYAVFAPDWQSINPEFSLDDDNDVDYFDLAIFCEDWLWQAGWAKDFGAGIGQTMGRGMGGGMSQAMGQTASEPLAPTEQSYSYELTEQPQLQLTDAEIQVIINWFEELWRTDENFRKLLSYDEWQKFIECLKQQINSN